jgi:multiple RNA-binding domain-containing protein 1
MFSLILDSKLNLHFLLAASAEAQKDAKLQDFIDTLQKGSKLWMNDDSGVRALSGKAAEGAKVVATKKTKKPKKEAAPKEVSVQKVPNRKPGGNGLFVTRQHVTFSAASEEEDEDDEPEENVVDDKMQTDDAGAHGAEEASSDDEYEDLPVAKRAKLTGGSSKSPVESDGETDEAPKQESGGSALDWLKSKAKGTKTIEKLLDASSDDENGDDSDSNSSDDDADAEADEKSPTEPKKSRSAPPKSRSASSKSSASSSESDDEPSVKPNAEAAKSAPTDSRSQQAGTVEDLAQAGRVFVRNLSYATTEEDLYKLFSKYGQISTVHLTIDKATKQSKGFGFVQFLIPSQAVKAFTELDAKIFQGRLLHLIPAKPQPQKGTPFFSIRIGDSSTHSFLCLF